MFAQAHNANGGAAVGAAGGAPNEGRVEITDSVYLTIKLSTRYAGRLDVSVNLFKEIY